MESILSSLPGALLPWYAEHKRDLPWRADTEPYHVWLSEIMLQQTRVEAVKGYYARFLAALPTVDALAQADEALLLKLWEGLGYYSRVRNLQKAARVILQQHKGQFPQAHKDILALPGIGDYTAGAIASIAFGQPRAAVDGNVLRVVSRLTAAATPISSPAYKKTVQLALEEIYPPQAGDFTQALMELGATLCGPNREPQCTSCPCRAFCLGYARGVAAELPVRTPKKARRTEEKTVFILHCDGHYALCKRPGKGLLAGLWQFPDVPGRLELPQALEALEGMGIPLREVHRQTDKTHIFTHIQWNMRGIYLDAAAMGGDFVWMTARQIEQEAALPTAYRQFWEDKL